MSWLRNAPVVLAIVLVAAAITFVASSITSSGRPPAGPVRVLWDRETCAHCGMLVGEPAFAVQVQPRNGRILFFDDPGCAITYLARHQIAVHAMFFRDHQADRWIGSDRVAFVPVGHTPMGYGLGAVVAGADSSISLAAARARVLARARGRSKD